MASKSVIKRIAEMVRHDHDSLCNVLTPCSGCRAIPKHHYQGPIDRADCTLCGYSIDMPCHDVRG